MIEEHQTVSHEEDAAELKEIGKEDKIKRKKRGRKQKERPAFLYYSILKGWQMLFALATTQALSALGLTELSY